jgi:alpha-L-fucosidase
MKQSKWIVPLVAASLCVSGLVWGAPGDDEDVQAMKAAGIPAKDSADMAWWRESMKTRDQRMAWWRKGRFGMFIHWGVYSPLGGTWQGKPVSGYAEHIQRKLKIPIPVYREKIVSQFNPTEFDADEWVRLAKDAGMEYLVITAKHHDGVAMWPSKVSTYNIHDGSAFKRDPMQELKAACDRHGVKFGFYYSHAFDWGDEFGPGNDWDFKNPGGDRNLYGGRNWWEDAEGKTFLPRVRKYVDGKSIPQIEELIRNYHPAIIWFDTPHKLPPAYNYDILKAVRTTGPDVVVNGRLLRGYGDYDSTADRPAEFSPHDGDWEGIPTTNESYGYNQNDHSHKPPAHFIQLVAKAAARGGNLLMNIGPMGNGKFDARDVEILRGISAWMKINGDSVHGTDRTPLPVQAWGESTRKGDALYLHVFDWPKDGKLTVGGLKTNVTGAYLLSDAAKSPLTVKRVNELDVQVDVPKAAPDVVDSVVVVQCEGTPAADARRLLATNQKNFLRAFDGQLHGDTIKFGPGKRQDAYAFDWTQRSEYVAWPVRITAPGTFDVTASYDAEGKSDGSTYRLTVAGQELPGRVRPGKEVDEPIGQVKLEPGSYEIRVEPKTIVGGELMRLRAVTLAPAEQ